VANIFQRITGSFRRGAPATAPRSVPTQHHARRLEYTPDLDGAADPGEIVWTWVKYEDDPHQGKDRPVLVVGRDGRTLLGLMLSSQSERDGQPDWLALGPGSWDREHRPSWIRLDRVLEVDEDGIRREGAVLDRERFDRVAAALREHHGWA
jgi:PemK-like, MazF-like toxin of type II toxin-antitoxin system